MKRHGVKSTRKKSLDTDLSDNKNTKLVFCFKIDPNDSNYGKIYSDIYRLLPIMPNKGNIYIYVMYVYDCNTILTASMKNRSDN